MTLLQAKADQYLIQQKPTQWFLHSIYQMTFNLTNESNNQLILVARENALICQVEFIYQRLYLSKFIKG
ncbi:hypothetical protein [Enterococcus lemanii]|uniref:Uncharacterized protein n=1 Tax=Enterococcus lemanii TaxID=1159752 RepID=A0ABV9MSZ6_9ENTE|nr:hypothetical protein [Enterococcus lemanii]MBM7710247.1 hypothetical protein [Enterococcus lemanii]